jgi:hypothetical protein
VLSPDPAITVYNKQLLKADQVPATVTQMGQDAAAGTYKVSTYTIDNTFGYSAFWGYVQKNGWASLDQLGPKTQIEADGGWLKTLQRSLGLTTIFVTHDQHEALGMSDRVS